MSSSALLNSPLVKDLVTCALCTRFLDQPKILPCQHSFCVNCIQNYFDQKEAEARRKLMSMRCPVCFTPTAIPLGGIAFFTADHKADKIKSLLQNMMMTNILRNSKSDHEGRQRLGSGSKSRPQSCNLEEIDFNTLAAELNIGKNKEVLNKTMPAASKTSFELTTRDAGTSMKEDTAIGLKDCAVQTEEGVEGACDVNRGFEEEGRDEGYDTLTTPIKTAGKLNNKRTTTTATNAMPFNGKAKGKSETADTLRASTQRQCQYSEQRRELDTKINTGPEVNNNSQVHRTCNDTEYIDQTFVNGASMGEEVNGVSMEEHVDGNVKAEMNGIHDEESQEIIYKTEPQLLWSVEKNENDMPTDIVVAPNGSVTITDYGNCKIQLYEGNGEYIHSIDNVKPFAIAFDKTTDNYVVADRKDKSIKVYDQGGAMVYDWEKNSFHWICGLSVTKNGDFVIFDRELTKIGLYNQEGTRISEFGSYGDGDSHLCMADFLTVDSKDRIIVCDSGHHCIKVFDTRGCFLGRFSERGVQPGQLLWPKSVTVDASDNILVTDQKNNRISLFSPDGRFIQHVLPKYNNPYNISLCGGKMGITSYGLGGSSSVSVYQL